MHELSLQVHERRRAVHRQRRRQLHHADDHERGDLAGGPGHREDHSGEDPRSRRRENDLQDGLDLRRAQGQRAFSHAPRHGRQALLGRHDHDRHRQERERQRRPQDTAGAERRGGEGLGEEQTVDRAADEVHEEPQAEDPEDDRRNAGEVVDRDAHRAHERPLPGVLAQVQRRQHAQRKHRERHEEDHHHGAEDRREDPAFGVRLARIVEQELAQARGVDAGLSPDAQGVGTDPADDVRAGTSFVAPPAVTTLIAPSGRVSLTDPVEVPPFDPLDDHGVFRVGSGGDLALRRSSGTRRRRSRGFRP